MNRVLITGGFGFIGSNLVRMWREIYPQDEVSVMDCMTYASNPAWVYDKDSEIRMNPADISNFLDVKTYIHRFKPDTVFHLAAESHVCRSIDGPKQFVSTNFVGTFNLLEACRLLWDGDREARFVHISTDEVFGELPLENRKLKFSESTQIQPRSPYAATKAGSDHLVSAYHHTYGMQTFITNCTNNFGPNQHKEKLIPKTITKILKNEPVTIYGEGNQVRDWIYVDDHNRALTFVSKRGAPGERYCIGGEMEMSNLDVVKFVYDTMKEVGMVRGPLKIEKTNDRPTDDMRYAVNCSKTKSLGWLPRKELFKVYMMDTIKWYCENVSHD